jgi:hypothetical protein
MGLQREVADAISALPLPKGFSVCELGDQGLSWEAKGQKSKPWYLALGCARYVSIDGNGRGTMTADLNHPIALDPFDLVTDLGTGEHVFNQAQIWRTLHGLCTPGGFIVVDRPTHGYDKHCFYLINECLLRDLAEANGYAVRWLARKEKARGELIRCIFQRPTTSAPFVAPQQGKYAPDLVISR